MKKLYINSIVLLLSFFCNAQKNSNTVYTRDALNNELGIAKSYGVASPYQSGQDFTYTISVSTQGNVGTFTIVDDLDPSLIFINWSHSALSSFGINLTRLGNRLTWTGNSPSSSGYIFDINVIVRFPAGITCDGEAALNTVSIESASLASVNTNPISIEAKAINEWSITKTAKRPSKIYGLNEIVEYDIVISGGGNIGRHGLSNINIQDILPPNATLISTDCNYSSLLPSTTPCKVKVRYPSTYFPAGSSVANTIELTGKNPCGDPIKVTDTETITIQDIPVDFTPGATITKHHYVQNKVPGCNGRFTMRMRNNGNVDLTDLELNDVFPTNFINITAITISNSSGVNLIYKTGVNPYSAPTSATNISAGIGNSISIKPAFGSTIKSGETVYVYVDFIIKSGVAVGTPISNTVRLNSITENISKQANTSFIIEEYNPRISVSKTICNPVPNDIYAPGDELVYRVKVTNSGSDPFLNGNFEDVLDNSLDYLGEVHVYKTSNSITPPCTSGSVLSPSVLDLTSTSTINFNTTSNTLNITLPNINADCQGGESVWVEFKVKVKPGVPAGRILNRALVYNSNISARSNIKQINIKEMYTLKVDKLLSVDGGLTYVSGPAIVPAATPIKYKITVENVGNNAYRTLNIIDIMPNPGDVFLSGSAASRGSTVGSILLGPISVPAGYQVFYSNSAIPDTTAELNISASGATPPGWSSVFNPLAKSIKIVLTSGDFNPLDIVSFVIDTEVDPNGSLGDFMCNSTKVRGVPLNNIVRPATGAGPICIEISAPDISCCKADLDLTYITGSDYFGEENSRIQNIIEFSGAPTLPLIPISEIRIAMSDIDITYDYEDCAQCINDPKLWGSMEGRTPYLGSGMTDTMLFLQPNIGTNSLTQTNQGFRELIWGKWSSSAGRVLQPNDALEFYTYLPPRSKIPCCATAIKICYTVSWKDANCNVCEKTICKTITLEPEKKKDLN